jgi:hypothetical protein
MVTSNPRWDFASGVGRWPARPLGDTTAVTAYEHKPVKCTGCGTRYKTRVALAQHRCGNAPGPLAVEALKAFAQFNIKSDLQARTLLAFWARRPELTEAEYDYVRKEVVK